MSTIGLVVRRLRRKAVHLWSGAVETHWHPPAGFFAQAPRRLARDLRRVSDSPRQAVARLTFYMNRAGQNLGRRDRDRLRTALWMIERMA